MGVAGSGAQFRPGWVVQGGIASFSFARANGSGGNATWRFVDAGGFFVTDTVATNDIALRLLPDEGSDVWNDVVAAVLSDVARHGSV